MKKLFLRIKAAFARPDKKIRAMLPQLKELKKQLEEIQRMPNKVKAIVRLFQVLAPFQDSGEIKQTMLSLGTLNYGQLDSAIKALEGIQRCLDKSHREGALNRSEKGEQVTEYNVFLGDVFGLWTKTAAYWLEHQAEFEKEDSGVTPKQDAGVDFISVWYCINDYQAGTFVNSHTTSLIKSIETLKAAA